MAAKNADSAPLPAFTSRSVAAVERATGAIVSRFAEPVRQLGVRTLGFVDRMLGARVFGHVQTLPGGGDQYVYARPWYELPRQARARSARAAEAADSAAAQAAAAQAAAAAQEPVDAATSEPNVSARAAAAPPTSEHVVNAPAEAARELSTQLQAAAARQESARQETTRAVEQRSAEVRRAAEQRTAEVRRAVEEQVTRQEREGQRAAEQRADEQRAQAEQRAGEQRAQTEQRAGEQRAQAEQRATEQRAAEQRASVEQSEQRNAQVERAAQAVQRAVDDARAIERESVARTSEQKVAPSEPGRAVAADGRAGEQRAAEQRATEVRAAEQQQRSAGQRVEIEGRAAEERATTARRVEEQQFREQQAAKAASEPARTRSSTAGAQGSAPPAAADARGATGSAAAAAEGSVQGGAVAGPHAAATPGAPATREATAFELLVGAGYASARPAGLPAALGGRVEGGGIAPAGTAFGRAFAHGTWVEQQLARGTAAPAERAIALPGLPVVAADGPETLGVAGGNQRFEAQGQSLASARAAAAPVVDGYVAPRGEPAERAPARSDSPAATFDTPLAAAATLAGETRSDGRRSTDPEPAPVDARPVRSESQPILTGIAAQAVPLPQPGLPAASISSATAGAQAALARETPGLAGFFALSGAQGGPASSLSALVPGEAGSLAAAGTARFIERLMGVRAALDARVLPVEASAPAGSYGGFAAQGGAAGSPTAGVGAEARAPGYAGALVAPFEELGEGSRTDRARAGVARGEPGFVGREGGPSPAATVAGTWAAGSRLSRADSPSPGAAAAGAFVAGAAGGAASPWAAAAASGAPIAAGADAAVPAASRLLELLRPGGIAGRAEQLAGSIGIRAAGVSIDFVDPERLGDLLSGRASAELAMLVPALAAPGLAAAALAGATGGGAAGYSSSVCSSMSGGVPGELVAAARSGQSASVSAEIAAAFAAAGGTAAPGGVEAALAAGGQASPATRQAQAAAQAEVARRVEAVWSLIRVFPASAQGALAQAASTVSPGAATAAQLQQLGRAVEAAQRQAQVAAATAREAATAGAGDGEAGPLAPTGRPLLRRDAGRGNVPGAPQSYVAPSLPAVAALDRPALPDGRMPRGGFLWSRAAAFLPTIADWQPPATVEAASSGAAAAASGFPVWGGMTPVAIPSLEGASFSDGRGEGRELVSGGDGAQPQRKRAAQQATRFVGGKPVASGPVPPSQREGRRHDEVLVAPIQAPGASAAPMGANAPLMRLVSAASGGVATTAPQVALPQLALVQTAPPPVASTPASDASARIVEAMRAQQESATGSEERITLSDLTLISTASQGQKLAASAGPVNQSQSNNASRGSKGKSSGETKKNPEAERREIEEIARHVLDEVERLSEVARERSGDPWEGGW